MKDKIKYESKEAASFHENISGWVDREGRYFGNKKDSEHMARWSGCDISKCNECGAYKRKIYVSCKKCREKRDIEKYSKRVGLVWNGETPLYSQATTDYYFSEDDLNYYLDEHPDATKTSLRLIVCVPNYIPFLNEDYFMEDLVDDGELPKELTDAIETLNDVVDNLSEISWSPGKYRAIVDE